MLRSKSCLWMATATLGACLLLAGCNRGHSWGSGGGGSHGFKDGVPYDYDIKRYTCDDRTFLLLVSNGFSQSGDGSSDQGFKGYMTTRDGRKTEWSCDTKDGKTGDVLIAGQQFDLSKGVVFLVEAKQDSTKVEQLSADLSKLPHVEWNELERAVRNLDPRVSEFLKAAQGEK